MEKLHFTLGDDAGLLLSQIAWERMFMDLSPAKAISIFVDSLQGLPYSLALELLHGDKVVEVSDKTSGIMSIVLMTKTNIMNTPYLIIRDGMREIISGLVIAAGNFTNFLILAAGTWFPNALKCR